jgi:hypothetical protein
MRIAIPCFLLTVVIVAGLAGQPADEFVFLERWIPNGAPLYKFSSTGALLATVATLPVNFSPIRLTTSENNTSFRVIGYFNIAPNYPGTILDVTPNGMITTLLSTPTLPGPEQLIRTCDGDWLVIGRRPGNVPLQVFRVVNNQLTTVSSIGAIWTYGVTLDPVTGLLIVRAVDNVSEGYYYLDPLTGVYTNMALYGSNPTMHAMNGARRPVLDPATGWIYDVQYHFLARTCNLVRVHPQSGITTLSRSLVRHPPDLVRPNGRITGFDFYLFVNNSWPPAGPTEILRVQKSGAIVGTTFLQSVNVWGGGSGSGVVRVGSRHLTWYMDNPPNGRSLHISFPGEAGRRYAVGFSLTGIRPGIALPDSRVIPLQFDGLTALSLTSGIPGMLENSTGALDLYGRAKVKVDTNSAGPLFKGCKIWAAAVVLDPTAPLGIAHIAGPTLLSIRQ